MRQIMAWPWNLGYGSFKVLAPFDRLCRSSYWRSMVAMTLSCIISEIKPHIDRKLRFFSYPLAFDARVRGSPSEYCHVCCGKTRVVWLPDGEKLICLPVAVLAQYRHMTDDGRTDRQTSCDSIVCAMHTHHAIKIEVSNLIDNSICCLAGEVFVLSTVFVVAE